MSRTPYAVTVRLVARYIGVNLHRSRWLSALVSTSVAAIGLAGCSVAASGERQAGNGPLSVGGVIGGNALTAPSVTPWRATFGHFLLCSTDPDVAITLDGIRAEAALEPLTATPRVRVMTASTLRLTRSGGPARGYEPVYSALGSPPLFDEPYAEPPTPQGSYSPMVGFEVTDRCMSPRDPSVGYTELLVTLEANQHGARIPHFWIDYTADGEPRSLRVDWEMTLCGTRTQDQCSGPPG